MQKDELKNMIIAKRKLTQLEIEVLLKILSKAENKKEITFIFEVIRKLK